ncbi:MAG: phenylacetate-CoA oxygenase subunit PaaC [Saprospiraceae bacterium]|nr:phenylacetate-CoA oxygenase subunit PaaC [Saprospiraceae bacterium]
MESPLLQYLFRLGDDSLILGHRLAEWCSRAPTLEEDLALTNMSLDHIGRAKMILEYAASFEALGRDADELAFGRDERHYHNLLITEVPNGDFAVTMVRMFLFSAFDVLRLDELSSSEDETLAGIAQKGVKESRYHRRHAADWIWRLGKGTDESHRRTQQALNSLWGYTAEMFDMDDTERVLLEEGIGCDLHTLREIWKKDVNEVFTNAGLTLPEDGYMHRGGRNCVHTEALGHIIAEMNYGYAMMQA